MNTNKNLGRVQPNLFSGNEIVLKQFQQALQSFDEEGLQRSIQRGPKGMVRSPVAWSVLENNTEPYISLDYTPSRRRGQYILLSKSLHPIAFILETYKGKQNQIYENERLNASLREKLTSCVKILLDAGANPNEQVPQYEYDYDDGWLPEFSVSVIEYAVRYTLYSVAILLVRAGATLSESTRNTLYDVLTRNIQTRKGYGLDDSAVENVLYRLIEEGANIKPKQFATNLQSYVKQKDFKRNVETLLEKNTAIPTNIIGEISSYLKPKSVKRRRNTQRKSRKGGAKSRRR
jgi:hypothetical protein